MPNHRRHWLIAAALAPFAAAGARAHGEKKHAAGPVRKEQKDWGIAGNPKLARRRIEVRMLDTMRFVPDRIELRQGETVRFVVHNGGRMLHEFVIGTQAENQAHAELMKKYPDMEHDEPWMAHVPAGKSAELVWQFNRPGQFQFACLIAGHYDAGMVGTLVVAAG
jgi:uncharacterized cupredoxin-like copper-binding protein